MLRFLRAISDALFHPVSNIETYILSKNPQSLEDIEYWIRQYDRGVGR